MRGNSRTLFRCSFSAKECIIDTKRIKSLNQKDCKRDTHKHDRKKCFSRPRICNVVTTKTESQKYSETLRSVDLKIRFLIKFHCNFDSSKLSLRFRFLSSFTTISSCLLRFLCCKERSDHCEKFLSCLHLIKSELKWENIWEISRQEIEKTNDKNGKETRKEGYAIPNGNTMTGNEIESHRIQQKRGLILKREDARRKTNILRTRETWRVKKYTLKWDVEKERGRNRFDDFATKRRRKVNYNIISTFDWIHKIEHSITKKEEKMTMKWNECSRLLAFFFVDSFLQRRQRLNSQLCSSFPDHVRTSSVVVFVDTERHGEDCFLWSKNHQIMTSSQRRLSLKTSFGSLSSFIKNFDTLEYSQRKKSLAGLCLSCIFCLEWKWFRFLPLITGTLRAVCTVL